MIAAATSTNGRIAITGASGQLGSALAKLLGDEAVALSREQLNIASRRDVQRMFQSFRPRAVVNCAAFTNVDAAEHEPRSAERINGDAVAMLAAECTSHDVALVQISTDYVFGADSARTTPYVETDATGPVNAYGRSKLAGEVAAAQWKKHFIVRTCGLYGPSAHGRNFVETILRLAERGQSLAIVNDQHCTPTSALDAARAVAFLLTTTAYGTYHIVNEGATTWHDFAAEILRLAKVNVPLRRITSQEYGGTPRPAYSVLDANKYATLGGPRAGPWRESLARYLAQRA